jgi:exopolyphosphatase/guanosine-5'-triphosphate,3'-diphosphate pyrophosphatase
MSVGVVDVGSNTVRLHVMRGGTTLVDEREMLGLGADVERNGSISDDRLERAAEVVAAFVEAARAAGVDRLQVLITSPGRQASNGVELLERLRRAADAPATILSAAEEGRLAFAGALDSARAPRHRPVAVVDVGGGSSQLVVGSRRRGVDWFRSIDLGSQRLTARLLSDDPPGERRIADARVAVRRYLDGMRPPAHHRAYAVGGSGRSLGRIAGGSLDADELDRLLGVLAQTPAAAVGAEHDLDLDRARTLAAGCVLLAEIQRVLGTPLQVATGGVREGAMGELRRSA